jgi:hypothetical protein
MRIWDDNAETSLRAVVFMLQNYYLTSNDRDIFFTVPYFSSFRLPNAHDNEIRFAISAGIFLFDSFFHLPAHIQWFVEYKKNLL